MTAIGLSGASVTADTPVYADPAGACNGLTPCFTTIQEAVNEVDVGGEVFVFPGAYAESVNLSDMNGGSPGAVSLTTVDAAGAPTPGTATVDAASGPALATLDSSLPGDVTIDGFSVTSPDDDGVVLDVEGNVVIANVTADTDDTEGGNGFKIDATGDLIVSNSTASGNGQGGFEPNVRGSLTICNSTANDNADRGFKLDLAGDLFLNGVTVLNNGKEGIAIDGTRIDKSTKDPVDNVTIQNSHVEGNAREGITVDDVEGSGPHLINGNIIALNAEAGVLLKAKDLAVNAEGNWWGDASGPTHPTNATGAGDKVVDSANGDDENDGAGTVDFDPWVDSGSDSAGPGPAPIEGIGPCPAEGSTPAAAAPGDDGASGQGAAPAENAAPGEDGGGFSWSIAIAAGVAPMAAIALVGVGVVVGARRRV